MTDAMTPEQCREHQRECAAAVRHEIEELRRQTAGDITAIRAAVQDIDRAVAQIKGYLGINGQPRAHHRDAESEEHLHRRSEDSLGGWVIKNLGWLIVTGLMLAAFAGERIVQHLTH